MLRVTPPTAKKATTPLAVCLGPEKALWGPQASVTRVLCLWERPGETCVSRKLQEAADRKIATSASARNALFLEKLLIGAGLW